MTPVAESVIKKAGEKLEVFSVSTSETIPDIPAGSSANIKVSVERTGYVPIGIVGVRGSRNTDFVVTELYLSASNEDVVYMKNTKTGAGSPTQIIFYVLYKKL